MRWVLILITICAAASKGTSASAETTLRGSFRNSDNSFLLRKEGSWQDAMNCFKSPAKLRTGCNFLPCANSMLIRCEPFAEFSGQQNENGEILQIGGFEFASGGRCVHHEDAVMRLSGGGLRKKLLKGMPLNQAEKDFFKAVKTKGVNMLIQEFEGPTRRELAEQKSLKEGNSRKKSGVGAKAEKSKQLMAKRLEVLQGVPSAASEDPSHEFLLPVASLTH